MTWVPGKCRYRLRWWIGGLLGAGVLVNYLDRIALAVTGPQLQESFNLGPIGLGLLLSAFFWSYAILQIPAGLLLDRFGVKAIGRWGAMLWVGASALASVAPGFSALLASRVLLGAAEAPSFPANAKATGLWFPQQERARSTAIFDAAAKFSNVIGVPIIAFAASFHGWRWGFALTAALSLGYLLTFWVLYRDPGEHPRLHPEERDYIYRGGAEPEAVAGRSAASMLVFLLRSRKVWGLTLGFSAYGYCFYFFLTWLPGYLVQSLHLGMLSAAGMTAIPWIFATLSDLVVGGWLVDWLISRGHESSRVRKSVLVIGLTLGLAVFGATMTTHAGAAVAFISVALSGLAAAAPVCWSLPALVGPVGGTGTVASIMNFGNNLMGAAGPIVTGYIVARTHSFSYAFGTAGTVLLVGLMSFVFLMGKVEPIQDP